MSVYEIHASVESVGYSTANESINSDADKKGMLIQLSDWTRSDGFMKKWFVIPEAQQQEMLDMAIAAIANGKRLAVGVEGISSFSEYKAVKNQAFPEIKSMFLTRREAYYG